MSNADADSLLGKHALLIRVLRTEWATKLDHKVAAEILERYRSQQKNARASLRYLEGATKSTRSNVVASTRRLVERGVFIVDREGKGTRPTEYRPNFSFPSGIADDTSTSGTAHDTSSKSSGIAGDTSSGIADDTSAASRGIVHDTESLLLVPVTTGDKVRDTHPPAPAHGLTAAPVGTGVVLRLTISNASIGIGKNGDTVLGVDFTDDEGGAHDDQIVVESASSRRQEAGQTRLQQLCRALDIGSLNNADELRGRQLDAVADAALSYVPADEWGRAAMGLSSDSIGSDN